MRKVLLASLMMRRKGRNLYAESCHKHMSLWNDVVASSSVLSKPNCQRLMKQSGSLVRSYPGTHSAALSPLELPEGRRQKSYVPTSLLGQSALGACLQGGRYLRTAPTTWGRTYAAHRLP